MHRRLPTWSPQRVAKTLICEPKAPVETPVRSSPTVRWTVDLGSTLRGATALANFLLARREKSRAAQRQLEHDALHWAAEYRGLLGLPDLVMRGRCSRSQALLCLSSLEDAQLCRLLCHYRGEPVYVFPGLLPRVWECDYCAGRRPVPQGIGAATTCLCTNCGATMTQRVDPLSW